MNIQLRSIALFMPQSRPALTLAAQNGQLSTVKVLLENGADPKRKNSKGKNAITLARLAKHNALADYMASRDENIKLFNWD